MGHPGDEKVSDPNETARLGLLRSIVAGDEPPALRLKLLRSSSGPTGRPAISAEEAHEAPHGNPRDPVISDLEVVPGRRGWDLVAEIAEGSPEPPLALAGAAANMDAEQANDGRIAAFLSRSYRLADLLAAIAIFVESGS